MGNNLETFLFIFIFLKSYILFCELRCYFFIEMFRFDIFCLFYFYKLLSKFYLGLWVFGCGEWDNFEEWKDYEIWDSGYLSFRSVFVINCLCICGRFGFFFYYLSMAVELIFGLDLMILFFLLKFFGILVGLG